MKVFAALLLFTFSALASNDLPLVTSALRLNFKDKQELKNTIKDLLDEESAVSIVDQVGKGKVELLLRNDYNLHNVFSSLTPPDDIGMTHGFKLSIHKDVTKVDGDLYYATLSYETNLYTNSVQPEQFQQDYYDVLYKQDGVYMADVYFKEENLVSLIVSKIKKHDAFYWSAQGGYHEINTKDSERPLLLSSITQQDAWHGVINAGKVRYRHYNYLDSDEGQSGLYGQAEAGFDKTLYESEGSRAFARYGANARASMVEGASYLGGFIKLGYERDSEESSMRVMTGLETKIYTSGTQSMAFIEAVGGGEDIQLRLRVVKPLNEDPGYLNPFPQDFADRENTFLPNEARLELGIQGKFDQR